MNIGVPKEIMQDESRVALQPGQAGLLRGKGHQVFVESTAGQGAGFNDGSYAEAGAKIVDRAGVYEKAELILKVKCPIGDEYDYYRKDHILFCYLHYDGNEPAEKYKRMAQSGATAIALEWVDADGDLVLLRPMSEMTGVLLALKSMQLLTEKAGMLPGAYMHELQPCRAMVIGVGKIGCNAINVLAMNGLDITIVDKHPETLWGRLGKYMQPDTLAWLKQRASVIHFQEEYPDKALAKIHQIVPELRIVICAADRRETLPKNKCRYILDRKAIGKMPNNSVVCDGTAAVDGFIETCVPSENLTKYYVAEGVIHYDCDHVPTMVPHSSTVLLTNATFEFVELLAEGFVGAVQINPALAKGVVCYQKKYTHEISATRKNLPYTPLDSLLVRQANKMTI